MSKEIRKSRKLVSATSVKLAVTSFGMAGMLAMTGCSTVATVDTAPTATASDTASLSSAPPVAETPKPEGKLIQTPNGPYVQATLPSAYLNYAENPSIINAGTLDAFSAVEVQSAKKYVMDFVATEGINSKAFNGGQTLEEWMVENESLFSPEWYPKLLQDVKEGKRLIISGKFIDKFQGSDFVYGENETRQTDVEVTPIQIWSVSNPASSGEIKNSLIIKADVSFNSNLVDADGKLSKAPTSGTMAYSVEKDERGGWLISGYELKVD